MKPVMLIIHISLPVFIRSIATFTVDYHVLFVVKNEVRVRLRLPFNGLP